MHTHCKSKKKQQSKKCRSKGINTRMCAKNSQLNKLCPFSVIENEMTKKMPFTITKRTWQSSASIEWICFFFDSFRFICRLIVHLLQRYQAKASFYSIHVSKFQIYMSYIPN